MSDELFVKSRYPTSLLFNRLVGGVQKYRIGRYLPSNGKRPLNMSSECTTEAAAWKSAAKRIALARQPAARVPLYYGKPEV